MPDKIILLCKQILSWLRIYHGVGNIRSYLCTYLPQDYQCGYKLYVILLFIMQRIGNVINIYRWVNVGVTTLPDEPPKLSKYYLISHMSGFKRHGYELIYAPRNLVLVHQIGDEKVAVDVPHRGATKLNNQTTLPSHLKRCKKCSRKRLV